MTTTSPEPQKPNESVAKIDHRALYQSYFECCNAHDLEGMRSFYTSPLRTNDEDRSPNEVTAQFEPLIVGFPDWQWEIRNLTVEGDYLALHFSITGTHQGDFQGIKPTGRQITTSEFTLYHVVDGKFARVWDLLDVSSLIKQIT